MSRSTKTLKRLTEKRSAPSMASVEASPAKTSATPATVLALKVPDLDFGPNTSDSFATYDPNSSSWRTSQRCLLEGWEQFSETWPRAGMTQSGSASRRPPLVPLISGTEFGYLPTPDKSLGAFEGFSRGSHGMDANTLFLKETVGERPSGARIGSSIRWCPEFIREWLRTGGDINPVWLERLMGFPDNHSATEAAETQSCQSSPRQSVGQ